ATRSASAIPSSHPLSPPSAASSLILNSASFSTPSNNATVSNSSANPWSPLSAAGNAKCPPLTSPQSSLITRPIKLAAAAAASPAQAFPLPRNFRCPASASVRSLLPPSSGTAKQSSSAASSPKTQPSSKTNSPSSAICPSLGAYSAANPPSPASATS